MLSTAVLGPQLLFVPPEWYKRLCEYTLLAITARIIIIIIILIIIMIMIIIMIIIILIIMIIIIIIIIIFIKSLTQYG